MNDAIAPRKQDGNKLRRHSNAKLLLQGIIAVLLTSIAVSLLLIVCSGEIGTEDTGRGYKGHIAFIDSMGWFLLYTMMVMCMRLLAREAMSSNDVAYTFSGILVIDTALEFLKDWDVTRTGLPFWAFAVISAIFAAVHWTFMLAYPVWLWLRWQRSLGQAVPLFSLKQHPVLWLYYVPGVLITCVMIFFHGISRRIWSMFLFILVAFSGIGYFTIPLFKSCTRHDTLGYLLLITGSVLGFLRVCASLVGAIYVSLAENSYQGVITLLFCKVLFYMTILCSTEYLEVLREAGRHSTSAILFAFQFGEDFVSAAIFVKQTFSLDFVFMLLVSSALNFVRGSGFIARAWARYKHPDDPKGYSERVSRAYWAAEQNVVSECFALPSVLTMILTEYLATPQVGQAVLTRKLDKNEIATQTVWVMLISVATKWLTAFSAHMTFRRSFWNLQASNLVDIPMDTLDKVPESKSSSSGSKMLAARQEGLFGPNRARRNARRALDERRDSSQPDKEDAEKAMEPVKSIVASQQEVGANSTSRVGTSGVAQHGVNTSSLSTIEAFEKTRRGTSVASEVHWRTHALTFYILMLNAMYSLWYFFDALGDG